MSSERRFPPTAHKLQKLRENGVVLFNEDLVTGFLLVGVFLGIALVSLSLATSFLHQTNEAFSGSQINTPLAENVLPWLGTFTGLVLAIGVPVLAGVLIAGAFQTKYLFRVSLLRVDFARLINFGALFQGGVRRIVQVASRTLIAVLFVLIASWYVRMEFAELALVSSEHSLDLGKGALLEDSLKSNPLSASTGVDRQGQPFDKIVSTRARLLFSSLRDLLALLTGGALFFGILSYLISVLGFRQAHRMTRAELEAEYREMEPSSEYRQAQRDFEG